LKETSNSPEKMDLLITQLVQRMKDKINGRLIKKNDLLDNEFNLGEINVYNSPKKKNHQQNHSETFY
jgi:hypothetical protein